MRNLLLYIFLVSSLFTATTWYERNNPISANTFDSDLKTDLNTKDNLVIERLNISLPIKISPHTDFKTEYLSKDSLVALNFMSNEYRFGKNIVIYGHNWPNMLKRLDEIKVGDKIMLNFYPNTNIYIVKETLEVEERETNTIKFSKNDSLTLFTCSGFLDKKRLIVIADKTD